MKIKKQFISFAMIVFMLFGSVFLAYSDVTIEFSDALKEAVDPQTQEEIQRLINLGLKRLAEENDAARDLLDSNQKIVIIAGDEEKAKELGIELSGGGLMLIPTPGSTKGDFDKEGKPKKGGTTYISLDADWLKRFGWHKEIEFVGSMWDVLVHELLHATNKERKHPPDNLDLYKKWVSRFNEKIKDELEEAKEAAETPKKRRAAKPKKSIKSSMEFELETPSDLGKDVQNLPSVGGISPELPPVEIEPFLEGQTIQPSIETSPATGSCPEHSH